MSRVQLAVLLEVRPQVTEELAFFLDLLVLKWLLPGPLNVFIADPCDKLLRRFQRLAGRDAPFLPKTTEHAVHRTARRLSSREPSVTLGVPLSQVYLWACKGFRKSTPTSPSRLHDLPLSPTNMNDAFTFARGGNRWAVATPYTSRASAGTSFCLTNFLSGFTPPKSTKRKRLSRRARKKKSGMRQKGNFFFLPSFFFRVFGRFRTICEVVFFCFHARRGKSS